jgi:hypothetical protein
MPRRVGRPAVQRAPNERVPIATRFRGDVYNRLIEEAGRNDRPLGNELELRTEMSLRDGNALDLAMTFKYGTTLSVALEVTGQAMLEISRGVPFPQTWVDRPEVGDDMAWAAVGILAAFQGREHPEGDSFGKNKQHIVGRLLHAIKFPEQAAPEQRHWCRPHHEKLGPEGTARLRVPPFIRPQIGPDGTMIGVQKIDGDTVTDLQVTNLPPARRHALHFDADGTVTAQSFDGDEVTVTTLPPTRRHAGSDEDKSGKG